MLKNHFYLLTTGYCCGF